MAKSRKNLDDALNQLGQEANYEKYRETARDVANKLKIQYDEFIGVGFKPEDALQLLMSAPYGTFDMDGMEFLDGDGD